MGENLASGPLFDITDPITQLEVDSHKRQRILIFNKAAAVDALAISTLISTTKKPLNKSNSNNAMLMFLFLVIGLSLFSLSVLTIVTSAQAFPGSTSSSNNSTSNEARVTQMGICQVGIKSPCNGDSNSPK
jgi:hypothetical protein